MTPEQIIKPYLEGASDEKLIEIRDAANERRVWYQNWPTGCKCQGLYDEAMYACCQAGPAEGCT